jgi:hypothetical protein
MGLLPSTPLACSVIANGGVGVSEHGGVGIDQPQVPQVVWEGVGETVPLLWKDASDILSDPLHLAAGGGGYEAQHQKLALRNVRGDRGNVGIIRSPVRATILPDRRNYPTGPAGQRPWPPRWASKRHRAPFRKLPAA